MRRWSILSAVVVLAACGTSANSAGVDAAEDVSVQSDISGTDAAADTGVDAISDTVLQDADIAQCLGFMADCKTNDQCCAPFSCLNITGTPKCQTEGPQQDIVVSDVPTPDAWPDVSPDVQPDSGPDAGDITANDTGINCSGQGLYSFQDLQFAYKGCTIDDECFAAFHQINCCGTKVAYGLNKSAMGVFQAYESVCDGQYPKCGCAQFQTQAEDGNSSFTYEDFQATCVAGKCLTSVKNAKPSCTSAGMETPKAFKWCGGPGDCDFSIHQVDCCGSLVFTGISKFAKSAFDAAEKACVPGSALCDCMPQPTKLDDGQTLTTNAVPVQCVNGACLTGKY